MPLLAVLRPESVTTPLRVVFNASAKNASGLSLNETLMIGPKLQPDLYDLLMKFRVHTVAFTADVSKMYRCIRVVEEDQDMQCVLWCDEPTQPIETYCLTTLTYSTASASYISTKCLQVLGQEVKESHPEASEAIVSHFYMDDLMTGDHSVKAATDLLKVIHETLKKAQFPLLKYASNCRELLELIDSSLTEKNKILVEPNRRRNNSEVKLQLVPPADQLTKKKISSIIAQVFEALDLVSRVSITSELLLQKTWRQEVRWKEAVSLEIYKFKDYIDKLRS